MNINKLTSAIHTQSGEKISVSFVANLVYFIVLKKPINLKSPIARRNKIIEMSKAPYLKYFRFIYLSQLLQLPIVINPNDNSPKATTKLAVTPGFIVLDPEELVGKTSSYQILPPKAQ